MFVNFCIVPCLFVFPMFSNCGPIVSTHVHASAGLYVVAPVRFFVLLFVYVVCFRVFVCKTHVFIAFCVCFLLEFCVVMFFNVSF